MQEKECKILTFYDNRRERTTKKLFKEEVYVSYHQAIEREINTYLSQGWKISGFTTSQGGLSYDVLLTR